MSVQVNIDTTSTSGDKWHVVEQKLSDGSSVYDLVLPSNEATITIKCEDRSAAERLLDAMRYTVEAEVITH